MNRIFFSCDIEGTCGIAHWDETQLGHADHTAFRRQMSLEAAAACRGALAGGADDLFVKDAHDSARNILPELLPEEAQIFRGWGSDIHSMVSGIDESFAGCIFTGYHSSSNFPYDEYEEHLDPRERNAGVRNVDERFQRGAL